MGAVASLVRCLSFPRCLSGLRCDLGELGMEVILLEGLLVWIGVWRLGGWMLIARLGIVRLGISVGVMAGDGSFLLDEDEDVAMSAYYSIA